MKTLKTILLGITAATLIAGCDSGGGGSDKTKPPVNNPPVISSVVCPAEINESEQGVCQINAYDSEGSLLSYSADKDWNYSFNANGEGTFTAPEVPSNTNYDLEFEVCDDKNACTTASTSILVKNVEEPPIDPPVENVLPTFDRFVFSNGSTHDDTNILQLRRKNTEGTIEATDLNGDNIYYEMFVNGDLTRDYLNGKNFGIIPTASDSTSDVEHLGDVTLRLCDEQNFDFGTNTCTNYNEKTFAYGEINPVQATSSLGFNENGTYYLISDATSVGSFLNRAEIYLDSVYKGDVDFVGDNTYAGGFDSINFPIENRENIAETYWFNDTGDEGDVVKRFTPASESEWRTIMRERLADWGFVEGVGSYLEENIIAVDGNDNPGCAIPSGTTEYITPDFTIFSNGNLATANYTSPTDNKTTDLEDYNKLKYCGNINNDLQMTMYPAYEIYNRIDEFHDLGFTFEE
ncbi:MAG: hypothetical protein ABFQ65_01590 [Nanoarchaeota archaeon]